MTITTVEFAIFTLVVLGLYYLLPHRAQNTLLLAASYLFLISWDIRFALVYLVLTLVNFVLVAYVARQDSRGRLALYVGIFVNVAALGFFKYADFFVPGALAALGKLGITAGADALQILLPIGLSFFVVQVISYLLDVSRGSAKLITDPVAFALYMAYFPRVVSGPIERSKDFFPRLQNKRVIDAAQIGEGIVLLCQGLIRKVVIADLLFILIPPDVFSAPQKYSSPELAIWLLSYAFALYNDFAGYTAIVRGVSNFFGIPLAVNFNAPYLARNFAELWRRWHITLSDWLRDYIFMPVTRFLLKRKYSRTHIFSIVLPPLITMFISALWHDVSLHMFVWGGMHGVYLAVEHAWMLGHPAQPLDSQPRWRQFTGIILVFALTVLAWVPFHTNLTATFHYWVGLLSPIDWIHAVKNYGPIHLRLWNIFIIDVVVLVGLSIVLDLVHVRFGEQAIRRCPVLVQAIAINVAVFALIISVMAQNVPPPFVYQGF